LQENTAELVEDLRRLLADDHTLAARLAALIGSTVITGDGNMVGDHNMVTVNRLSSGDYAVHTQQLHVTLSPDQLRSLLVSIYTPPPLPDPEVLPDPGPLPPGFRIPFQRNALFTGRIEVLKALGHALLHSEAGSTLVVGMGGVGKTQLAVEFAYRYGRFFHGVHWVNAGEPEAIEGEVAACGEAMGLPDWPEKQPEQVARTLGEWQRGGPRLVVLDHLEQVGAAREWLARLSGGALRVLVTARRTDWPGHLGLRPLRLESFTPEESRVFLRQHLPDRRATEADLQALAERLYHLPLALELAGRYLGGHARLPVADYLVRLENIWEHPSMAGWREELGNPTEHDLRLAETFAVSWEQVEDETARRLFLLAGYCAPNQLIPCEVLEEAAGIDREACDGALWVLTGLGLLEMGDPEAGPTVHPLLAEYGHAVAPSAPEGEGVLGALASALSQLARAANVQMDQTGSPSHFVPLLPHVRLVAETAERAGLEDAANLWNSLGYRLNRVTDLAGARAAYERALAIDERAFGPDHPEVATDVNNLGSVLKALGDLAGARAAFERALAIDERAFGPDHPNVARDVNNLGDVLRDLGDLAEARAAFRRVSDILAKTLPLERQHVASTWNNLGSVLQDLGDLAGARAAFERALAIDERTFGPDHPNVATDVNNLGSVLQGLGDLAGARAAFERALAIDERAFGPDHPNVAIRVNNLGSVLQGLGDLAGARAAFERALAIDERTSGPDHPNVAIRVNNLGSVLQALGELAGARAAYERALAIDERAFGPDHPSVAIRVNNLGSVLQGLGDLAGARAAFERALAIDERALAIDERAFGPDHPNVAIRVNNLGSVLQGLGDLAGARAAFERALTIDEKAYGPDHPNAARDLGSLGRVLYDLDEVAGAQAAFERALAIDEKAYGPSHPSVAGDRDNLAMASFDLEGLVKACLDASCVLFAGSGLSERAGLPGWDAFVEGLRAWAVGQGYIDERQGASLRRSIEAGDSSLTADNIASTLQRRGRQAELNAYLGRIFEDPALQPTEIHHILQGIHFGAALTPTYDRLLEQTFQPAPKVYAPADAESLLGTLAKRGFFLLKLRGALDRPETVMLAPTQYQDALASNRMLAQFMSSLFVSQTILFLGASPDEILTYCEGIMFAEAARQHYAIILVSGSAWEAKVEQLRQRYNIQVLLYQSREAGRELALVRALARRVQAKAGTLSPAERRRKRSQLKTVRLENIGPFQELSLDMDAHWSIVLGDNGVGKSTILKAIALAICGDDARPYADRLIRVGAPSGRITLETTEGARYVTELRRTAAEAEVVSVPQRLLEIEGWLALGFPPLRGMGWQLSPGPQPGPAERWLSPADLLPLMTGALDPRTNELKQWIVNLDYQVIKGQDSRSQQRFDDFFEVVGRLTVGMKLESGKVDPKTYQVTVETDDGKVPIELVSQGAQSLLGWVGVLMERMYEQHDRADQPRKQPALVLIDEIDAHMHPLWQQGIVPGLSELFPQVQFIATTHSPLIVGGLPPTQIIRLARDPNGRVVRLPIEEDMVLGRADQLLTSNLFGLETTLDKTIQETLEQIRTLSVKPERTAAEERVLAKLRQTLEARIPVPQETPAERRAQELLHLLLESQLGDLYPEVQDSVRKKAEQLFAALQAKEGMRR